MSGFVFITVSMASPPSGACHYINGGIKFQQFACDLQEGWRIVNHNGSDTAGIRSAQNPLREFIS
jgi:hypothetical protein